MLIKHTPECIEFTANDGCRIREVLHPKNDAVELPFSLAFARVEPGRRTYGHTLKQVEVYYVLSGTGLMHVAEESAEVGPGDAVCIPAGTSQWIENTGTGELTFAAIVSPPWREEDDTRL